MPDDNLKKLLRQLHAAEYPPVLGIAPTQVQALYHLAKQLQPAGLMNEEFMRLECNGTSWELRYFTHRGDGNDVEFAVFEPGQHRSCQSFIIYADGRVERCVNNQPLTSTATPPDVATLVGLVQQELSRLLLVTAS